MYNLVYKFVHSKTVFCAYCCLLVAYIGFLWTVPPSEILIYAEPNITAEMEVLKEQLCEATEEIEKLKEEGRTAHGRFGEATDEINRLNEEIEARNDWATGLEGIIFELEDGRHSQHFPQ